MLQKWGIAEMCLRETKYRGGGVYRTILGGPHPQYGWDFPEEIPEKFRKDPGNALRAFPGISLESTAGMPQAL